MRFGSCLLRVLLSLCLAVNGVAAAAAGGAMPAAQVAADPAPKAVATGMAGMPCHHTDAKTRTAAVPSSSPSSPPPTPRHDHADARGHDCCQSKHCHCPCAMHAPIALPSALAALPPQRGHDRGVRRLSLAHAPPALAHLIRPPIV